MPALTQRILTLLLASPHVTLGLSLECDSTLVPDPASCSSFLQCSGGEIHKTECPPGLLFNPSNQQCDWPDNVDCTSTSFFSTSSSTTSTTPFPPSSTLSSSSTTSSSSTNPSSTASPSTSSQPPVTTSQTTPSLPPPDIFTTTSSTEKPSPTVESSSSSSSISTPSSSSSSCLTTSTEPITEELRSIRESTCSLPNSEVNPVTPGRPGNPANVLVLESVLSPAQFSQFFPRAHPAYTYTNLLRAVAKFPAICEQPDICRRTLANMFAHFQQETAGLVYLREINKSNYCATWTAWVVSAYPCTPGKQYYGRGAKQLSWNYNYGAFSLAMYGDSSVLLKNPDLVADTWLNFASGIWFFVTPQPPKPSMLSLVDGSWQPNDEDKARGLRAGLGATTMAINGEIECGNRAGNNRASQNRQTAYKRFSAELSVDIVGEKLDCVDMKPFNEKGSSNPAIYWAPETRCRLVRWQTAFPALLEGEHSRCLSQGTYLTYLAYLYRFLY